MQCNKYCVFDLRLYGYCAENNNDNDENNNNYNCHHENGKNFNKGNDYTNNNEPYKQLFEKPSLNAKLKHVELQQQQQKYTL